MARERKNEEEERKMRSLKAKLGTLKTKGDPKVPQTKRCHPPLRMHHMTTTCTTASLRIKCR